MKHVVPSHARSQMPLADALAHAFQQTGPLLFSRLVRERAARIPPVREAARSLFSTVRSTAERIRQDGLRQTAERGRSAARRGLRFAATAPGRVRGSLEASRDYFLKLPTAQDRAEYILSLILYLLSFLAGFTVGYQVPQVDFKMERKGAPGDRIVLHAFPLMFVELALDWVKAVLEQVRDGRNLSPQDYRRLEGLLGVSRNLRSGVRTGAATFAWQRRHLGLLPLQGAKDMEVSLQNRAFAHAERLFRSLTQGGEQ